MEILVVTHNLWRESRAPLRDLHEILAKRPVAVGLNEAANHIDKIRLAARQYGYEVLVADDSMPRAARNNVLLTSQTALNVRDWGVRLQAPSTAGTPARYQVWADVGFKGAGRRARLLVDHANAHIENRAWWRLPRQGVTRAHLRKIGRQIKESPFTTLHFGDMNLSFRNRFTRTREFFYVRRARTGGGKSSYEALGTPGRGTKGRRLIDYITARVVRGVLRFKRQWVGEGYASDHRPLFVVFELKPARRSRLAKASRA